MGLCCMKYASIRIDNCYNLRENQELIFQKLINNIYARKS